MNRWASPTSRWSTWWINGSAYRSGVQKLGKGIGGRIIKEMQVRCLVSGNVFHCGDHGSYFKPEVSTAHRLLVVEDTLRRCDKGATSSHGRTCLS